MQCFGPAGKHQADNFYRAFDIAFSQIFVGQKHVDLGGTVKDSVDRFSQDKPLIFCQAKIGLTDVAANRHYGSRVTACLQAVQCQSCPNAGSGTVCIFGAHKAMYLGVGFLQACVEEPGA